METPSNECSSSTDRDRDSSSDSDCDISSTPPVYSRRRRSQWDLKSPNTANSPSNIIFLRELPYHLTEADIRQQILPCGLIPTDIRVIRKLGNSRGLAFVEFATVGEAIRWMDLRHGVLIFQNEYRTKMEFSVPSARCGTGSRRRNHKCQAPDETSSCPTNTIMIRNLDPSTTEESLLAVLNSVIPDLVKDILGVRIVTSTSRGICYLGTENTGDASAIHTALSSLASPLTIDGKTVDLSYCKYNMGQKEAPTASMTAAHSTNAAAAVAQSAIRQVQAVKDFYNATRQLLPTGTDERRYPVPDGSKYVYDKATGYYYDAGTGLYYDPNSNYYWNGVIRRYLYWDQKKKTYRLAPTTCEPSTSLQPTAEPPEPATKPKSAERKEEPAMKIAKDMERWAKRLRSKQEVALSTPDPEHRNRGAADVGFSMFQVRDKKFLDYSKRVCNLCKRQLVSAAALSQHARLSALHQRNWEARRRAGCKGRSKEGGGSDGSPPKVYLEAGPAAASSGGSGENIGKKN